jgi:hypothetical protein
MSFPLYFIVTCFKHASNFSKDTKTHTLDFEVRHPICVGSITKSFCEERASFKHIDANITYLLTYSMEQGPS